MKKEVSIKKKVGRPVGASEIDFDQLFTVSRQAFADKGFEGTSLTEIAEMAKVSRTTLNYYFQGKEGLWEKSMEQLANIFINRFQEHKRYQKDLEGLALLKVIIRQLVYFFAYHVEYVKIIHLEMQIPSPRRDWLIENLSKPLIELTRGCFKSEVENGTLKKIPGKYQVYILTGMASAFFLNSYSAKEIYGADAFNEKEIEQYADTVIDLFFNGILSGNLPS